MWHFNGGDISQTLMSSNKTFGDLVSNKNSTVMSNTACIFLNRHFMQIRATSNIGTVYK